MKVQDYLGAHCASVFRLFEQDVGKKFDELQAEHFAYIKGDVPICLVAHIDTVRTEIKPLRLIETDGVIRAVNSVLGADDRAGVFAIAELYKNAKNGAKPSILLTNDEEIGGIGVKAFCAEYDKLPFECNLFIELDRKGANDYVSYNELPLEVEAYIEGFGFEAGIGSYSDIQDLTDCYLVPSVNLSIGYYNQHTKNEFLVIDTMMATINRVARILQNPIEALYQVEPFDLWEEYMLEQEELNGFDWRDYYRR